MLAGDGEPDDTVVPTEDDAVPGEFWLAHAVITSPHAAAARALTVAVRLRAAARVSP